MGELIHTCEEFWKQLGGRALRTEGLTLTEVRVLFCFGLARERGIHSQRKRKRRHEAQSETAATGRTGREGELLPSITFCNLHKRLKKSFLFGHLFFNTSWPPQEKVFIWPYLFLNIIITNRNTSFAPKNGWGMLAYPQDGH